MPADGERTGWGRGGDGVGLSAAIIKLKLQTHEYIGDKERSTYHLHHFNDATCS